jgi:hypothetical protein
MTDRASAWARRAEQATGSRRVTAGAADGGVLDDIDALLAEEEPVPEPRTCPKDEDDPEPYL